MKMPAWLLMVSMIVISPMAMAADPLLILKAGNWHLTNVSSHPLIGTKEKTKDRCFDEKLVADLSAEPNRLLGDQKQQCEISQFTRKGNHLSWKVHCTEKMELSGAVEVWLDSPTAYHGKGLMKSDGMWPPGELKSEFSGMWMSECPMAEK